MPTLKAFWRDTTGASSIEYAFIAGGIFLAIIAAVKAIGPQLSTKFGQVSGNLS